MNRERLLPAQWGQRPVRRWVFLLGLQGPRSPRLQVFEEFPIGLCIWGGWWEREGMREDRREWIVWVKWEREEGIRSDPGHGCHSEESALQAEAQLLGTRGFRLRSPRGGEEAFVPRRFWDAVCIKELALLEPVRAALEKFVRLLGIETISTSASLLLNFVSLESLILKNLLLPKWSIRYFDSNRVGESSTTTFV